MASGKVSLEFYALGNYSKDNLEVPKMKSNNAFRDTSSDLLNRNKLSLNSNNLENLRNSHKAMFTIYNSKIDTNNYMNPLKVFKSVDNYSIDKNMVNKEMYRLTKDKLFAKDTNLNETLSRGMSLTKQEFLKKKSSNDEISKTDKNRIHTDFNKENVKIIKDNNLYFDKNHTMNIRYPKNFFKTPYEKQSKTKVSRQAPEWFQVVTEEKNKKYDEIIAKNEETLSILSRYNKWITVTPKSKNRKMPLEKMKIVKIDETSRIMPNWMQIRANKDIKLCETMKSVEYNSIRYVILFLNFREKILWR